MKCTHKVLEKGSLTPRCCRNIAVKDGLCNAHHPDAIQRRMRQEFEYWSSRKGGTHAKLHA